MNFTNTSRFLLLGHGGTPPAMRVLFGIIAFLSVFCNGLLCVVFMRNPSMLRSSYHVLILTLAVTDTLTGMMISISPDYLVGRQLYVVPEGFAGELYCRLIDNNFFVWNFTKFSVTIVTCMAIERWFAVARPVVYRVYFTKGKVYGYIAAVWFLVCVSSSLLFFEKNLDSKSAIPRCVWKTLVTNKAANQAVTVMYCSLTYFLPLSITLATFFHIQIKLKNLPIRSTQERRRSAELKLSRMGALVAMFLAICFVPNQISYIMYKFGLTRLATPQHRATVVLSMLNSCVNPFLYCATSKAYRKEFRKILCPCKNNDVSPCRRVENTINANLYELKDK